ncbi:hypothetical protein [Streptomyces sp. NPDC058683]|uniref:hypothetical protein n=1 Tax=Streptomyces sp. NPDC058683 TaxID=3346597 RepID=UPI003664F1D9
MSGWTDAEVLEAYKKLETTSAGEDELRGRLGPLPVHQLGYEELTPSLQAFIDAAADGGFRRLKDVNGTEQNGVTAYQLNVLAGVRQNTGMDYLTDEVRSRPNLTIYGQRCQTRSQAAGIPSTGVRQRRGDPGAERRLKALE